MKILNIAIGTLFLLFAVVQFNDPDPLFWIAMYSGIAAFALLNAFKIYFPRIIVVAAMIVVLFTIQLAPDFLDWLLGNEGSLTESMKAEKPEIEFAREFLGLIMCLAALLFLWLQARGKRRK